MCYHVIDYARLRMTVIPPLYQSTSARVSATHTLEKREHMSADSTCYYGNFLLENGGLKQYSFASGYITGGGSKAHCHYYIRDHQGNNRVVVSDGGVMEQTTHYYPYGGIMSQSTGQGVQKYKYNAKELDRTHGLDWYDYVARQYDPAIARFTSMDPLCERYYSISPYAYCAGNPIRYVDFNGDSISVAEQHQQTFLSSMRAVFGDFADNFRFTQSGMLEYSGNIEQMNKRQKRLLAGMEKIISEEKITYVIYDNEFHNDEVDITPETVNGFCGALTACSSTSKSNYIVIEPKMANDKIPVYLVNHNYYEYQGRPHSGVVMFSPQTCDSSLPDKIFHEFGHILYDGQLQSLVIDYNNYARKLLGLSKRKYDSEHNKLKR